MKSAALILGLGGLGLAAYLFLRPRLGAAGPAPGPAPTSPAAGPGGGSFLPPIGGVDLTPIAAGAALGPVGAIAGAGAVAANFALANPEQARKINRGVKSALVKYTIPGKLGAFGEDPVKKARRKRNNNRALVGESNAELQGAEEYAQAWHQAVAADNVLSWQIAQDGATVVRYTDRADPFILRPPQRAINSAAWAFEGPVRVFGSAVQGGTGPVRADFYQAETPGFSDANPYVPINWRASVVAPRNQAVADAAARKR